MSSVDKEQLLKVREFLENHPEEAKKFFEKNPEALEKLTGEMTSQNSVNNSNSNSIAGKQLLKAKSNIPRMFSWDEQGFSNYLMLAVLAFSIQFIITLVCILVYK